MASGNATVLLLLFVWSHRQRGARRWALSFRPVPAAAGAEILHAGEGNTERGVVGSGLWVRSQKNAAASCLLRFRNVYLTCVIYTHVQRGPQRLTPRHVMAVNGQIGCCKKLNL